MLTVFNRREKTLACLDNCYRQIDGMKAAGEYDFTVYLVDDGSTDGTSEAVRGKYPQTVLIRGNGGLYWNRGMRLAWEKAAEKDYDFYLWLNDDTLMKEGALGILMETSVFLKHKAIIAGTCVNQAGELSYGGRTRSNRLINPDPAIPEPCHMFNGNLVLVHGLLAYVQNFIQHIQRVWVFVPVFSEPLDGWVQNFFLISTW